MQSHCIYPWKSQKSCKVTQATVLSNLRGQLQVYSCDPLSIQLSLPAIVQLQGLTTILRLKAQSSVDISNKFILCSPYQQILPSAVQQDLAGALWPITMFSSCFSPFSDMIYTQLHYYTHKQTISHESMAVSKLRNTISALLWHPPILGCLIGPSSISGQASRNCTALLVLVICDHPFSFYLRFTKFFLFVCTKCFQLSFSIIFPLLIPSPVHF